MGAFRLTPPLPAIIFPIFYEEIERKKKHEALAGLECFLVPGGI